MSLSKAFKYSEVASAVRHNVLRSSSFISAIIIRLCSSSSAVKTVAPDEGTLNERTGMSAASACFRDSSCQPKALAYHGLIYIRNSSSVLHEATITPGQHPEAV